MASPSQVEQLKSEGNKHFSAGNHTEAIKAFSAAVALAADNHILYSNRSAAYASLKDYTAALADAEKCVQLQPAWAKGYSRLGAALHGLSRFDEAEQAYEKGLKLEPDNAQLKKGLEDVQRAQASDLPNLGGMFSGPDKLAKLATDPRTAPYMSDPSFQKMLQELQADRTAFGRYINDPRFMNVLSVLMGVDIRGAAPNGEMPMDTDAPNSSSCEHHDKSANAATPKPMEPAKAAEPEPEPEPSMSEEDKAKKEKKAEATKQKELGTAAYKQRNFDVALVHYTKASELDPTDIAHLNNMAAVYIETKQFDKCIEVCHQAVEKGREVLADFKLIAKALGRIGTAYQRMDNLPEAIKYFNKALTEHRTPDILEKLRETEKLQAKREREAYINPEIADQEREKGNDLFKKADFAGAIKAYSEAIKRNPTDPRNLTNRASAFLKIMQYNEANRDCEEAIAFDPSYTKAYVRRGAVLLALKKYNECLSALTLAEEKDTDQKNHAEIAQLRSKAVQAMMSRDDNVSEEEVRKRAAADPEVMQIMADPVMRSILEQMQNDPGAIKEHLKNPMVARKLQKLIDAGIIRFGSGGSDD